ncbi:type II toxin-antitoxin system death-on-curing family toxin [Vibrio parahaemolyticus]|nr:type II toxin-antitoxin system death-on-curing family toxin [Vibrio parahaemolyticus]
MDLLSIDDVIQIHDEILETEPGRIGYHGDDSLGGALGRIENQVLYGDLEDIYEIAAFYVEAISMGHCFADANKRTALTSALTFLEIHGITIKDDSRLADAVEDLVKRQVNRNDLAEIFVYLSE